MYLLPDKVKIKSYKPEFKIDNFSSFIDYFLFNNENLFYFSNPSSKYEILAIGKTFSINSDIQQIQSLYDELFNQISSSEDKTQIINIPLLFGYYKFPSISKEDTWKDFQSVEWILPEIVFYRKDTLTRIVSINSENYNKGKIDDIRKYSFESDNTQPFLKVIDELSFSDWEKKVAISREMISLKHLEKIVLSRKKEFKVIGEIKFSHLSNELNNQYEDCFNFLIKSKESIFFGSSPELLIQLDGKKFRTEALAGSIKRGEDDLNDLELSNFLLNDKKNLLEHKIVTDYIQSTLSDKVSNFIIYNKPKIKKLKNIQHLNTEIRGEINSNQNIFDLIETLFPTPAVCGIPKEVALNKLFEIEGFERGIFTGLVGWMNFNSKAELYVAIRCGMLKENKLTVYAGCGIVEDSDALDEYNETELKLKAITDLFNVED